MADKSTNKYDELDQGTPFGMAGEAMEMAKSKYDKLDHPEAEEIKEQAPYVPDIAPPAMGAVVGAGLTGTGAGGRMLIGSAADVMAQKIAEATGNKLNINTLSPADVTNPTSGGRWAAKTGYGKGEGTTEDVASRYKRAASPSNTIMGRLEKKFGVRNVGESSDLFQRLIDKGAVNSAENSHLIQQAKEAAFWESPVGKALSATMNIGQKGAQIVGEVGRGALNGANIASQINEGLRAYNEGNQKTAAAHGVAGGLSAADLATAFLPEAERVGLRYLTGPGAMIASSVAEGAEDVNKGNYGALPVTGLMGAAGLLGGPIGLAGFGTMYGMKHLTHPVAPEEYEKSPLDYGASQGLITP